MDTTYTPFCSEIPFLRDLRKNFASPLTVLAALFCLFSAAAAAFALPAISPVLPAFAPALLACPVLLGLWGHARGRKPFSACAFGWLLALTILLCLAFLAGVAAVILHLLGVAGFALPTPLSTWPLYLQLGLAGVAVLLALTLLYLLVFFRTLRRSIQNGLSLAKGMLPTALLLYLWSLGLAAAGGYAAVFYAPQSPYLALPLPFNPFLAAAALFAALACVLFGAVLLRVRRTIKIHAKY